MDTPKCEMCGEDDATLQTSECAVCDDCFAVAVRPSLREALGRDACCQPLRAGGLLMLCLEVYGTEHSHGSLR